MITNRDKEVINFIDSFKVATTQTIADLFYPNVKIAQRRLRILTDHKQLKRDREHFTSQYYYYIAKPKQIRHCLLLTQFYSKASKLMSIEYFDNEFSYFEEIRPDGFMAGVYKEKNEIYFVEVEISNTPDVEKYEKLYLSGRWNIFPKFPTVIFITDKKVRVSKYFRVIVIGENMENIGGLI